MCIRDSGKTVNAARNEVEGALEAKKKELAGAELAARIDVYKRQTWERSLSNPEQGRS